MASLIMHIITSKIIGDKYNLSDRFVAGSGMPDVYAKCNIERDKTHFIETGFKELDDVLGGFHLGEELVVIFARTGQGKTWVSLKMLEHIWKMNKRVGLLEPEN